MKKKLIIYLLVLFIFLCGEITEASSKYNGYTSKQCIEDIDCAWYAFENIAFGKEFENSNKTNLYNIIKKWKDPIYVGIAGEPNEKKSLSPVIEKHLNELSKITGLPITLSKKDVNMIILLSDDYEKDIYGKYFKFLLNLHEGRGDFFKKYSHSFFQKHGNNTIKCLGYAQQNIDKKEIFANIIMLPTNVTKKKFKSCVEEEITQGLGLINDIKDASFTLFNDSYSTNELTTLDKLILKILYLPEMKIGMNKKEAKPVFYKVYKRIKMEKTNG